MSIQQNLAGAPLEPMACLAVGSWPDSGAEYGFHLMQQDINPAKEWFVTPIPSYCCSFKGSQLGKMFIFLLQSHAQQLLAQWKLAGYFSQTRLQRAPWIHYSSHHWPALGWSCMLPSLALTWVVGIQTQDVMFAQQTHYSLSHLPSLLNSVVLYDKESHCHASLSFLIGNIFLAFSLSLIL